MIFSHDPMLSGDIIIQVSAALLLISLIFSGGKKGFYFMLRKQGLLILSLAILTILLSYFVIYSKYSGEGVATLHGWPHFMYRDWLSLDHSVHQTGVSVIYLGINMLFYLSIYIFLFSAVSATRGLYEKP
jgi:sensor histidine kinase YesM